MAFRGGFIEPLPAATANGYSVVTRSPRVPDDDALPSPYQQLGGRDAVVALAHAFYDAMEAHEPELTALHRCVEPGKIHPEARERFALFLVGWLGGPQDYMAAHGHPRLRMRHARVPVSVAMRDAWLRSMSRALTARGVRGDLRAFLDARFAEVADFLRNVPE